ncbi:GvpL/GvpF family gas vesicle protein [Polymorphospora sp. NPDC051019]|uniref:GvpL/GvpF family gas vesicle protein n=1 Tax=Polymorphospora sp. NPDC051019 TaxID=3155725 RepID=UPI00344759D7
MSVDTREAGPDTNGFFIYGLVPADVEPTGDARGVGDPAAPVSVVVHGDVAALVSDVPLDRPLGRPDDLRAYQTLLDGVTLAAPVLPVRFGTVARDEEAVTDLLADRHDDYRRALDRLEGVAQYVVRLRYVERAVLSEVLAGNAEAADLRDRLQGQPAEALRDVRIRLGEVINAEVEARRAADTEQLLAELSPVAVTAGTRPPTSEFDAAHLVFLVETERRAEFEDGVERIAAEQEQRATVRLIGPQAPYDFVDRLLDRG